MSPLRTARRSYPFASAGLVPASVALGFACLPTAVIAQNSDADLAKKLSNPVADLISVPLQFNYDGKIGPLDKGSRVTLNIQPVIPVKLNDDWNLISRTILPLVSQSRLFPGSGTQSGNGDILQSLFLSPAQPTPSGILWGAGPIFLIPTGSDKLLSAGQWGGGPTFAMVKQTGQWTAGVLANHIWSFAETRSNAAKVSNTLLNPFLSFTTLDQWTFGASSEATYDWERKKLTVPVSASVSKLIKIGGLPLSLGLGVRYYAISPHNGPKGFGGRASITFLFPT